MQGVAKSSTEFFVLFQEPLEISFQKFTHSLNVSRPVRCQVQFDQS